MSSQDSLVEEAWSTQINNYVLCGMSSLVAYRILLNLDQEFELIWKRSSSNWSMALYGLLTYGGATEALLSLLPLFRLSYNTCITYLAVGQGAVSASLIFGLNAIMALRVYAMYSRSKVVLIFLATCFIVTQALNIASSIDFMATISVFVIPLPETCGYVFLTTTIWLEVASNFAVCLYEMTLLVMVLYRLVGHMRESKGDSVWNLNTLLAVMVRDHVFYFVLACLSWVIQASSMLPDFPAGLRTNLPWIVFGVATSAFGYTMIGPIMFLSIRQFDAENVRGGTSTGEELCTLQFAIAGRQAEDNIQPEYVREEV